MRTFLRICVFILLLKNVSIAQQNIIIEEPPVYIGDEWQFNIDVNRYLIYPESALKRNITGIVSVKLTIDSLGNVIGTSINEGITPEMDSAAIKLVKFREY